MKNTADLLTKWRRYYANRCKEHVGGYEKMPISCYCETAAQIATQIEYTIPEEYQRYEIDDFTGMKNGKRVIKPEVVVEAKESIFSYCWGNYDAENIQDYDDFKKRWAVSTIAKRKENGESIIIYGNPWKTIVEAGRVKTFKLPIGRTMLAAIVMKEAIRLRARPGHIADTYAWIPYSRLYEKLMQRAKDDDMSSGEVDKYETCDWLCVDGFEIEKQNEATKIFKSRVLDSFFYERTKNGLPNILVFQDDLTQDVDLRQEFGLSVSHLINSQKTTLVKLVDGAK